MFRNYNKRKVIVLCLGLAAMTMLPQWVSAQDNGGSGTQAWSGKSLFGRDGSGNGYSVSTSDGGSHAGSFVSLFGRQNFRGVSGSGSGYSIFVEQFGGENGGVQHQHRAIWRPARQRTLHHGCGRRGLRIFKKT